MMTIDSGNPSLTNSQNNYTYVLILCLEVINNFCHNHYKSLMNQWHVQIKQKQQNQTEGTNTTRNEY